MGRYIAFLRAINVGGHTVKMELLCRLFESFGYSNVETFISSGNVVLEKTLKVPSTLRGMNTIKKLAEKFSLYRDEAIYRG
jgi:uncharacterized protein (DUF1697 family)